MPEHLLQSVSHIGRTLPVVPKAQWRAVVMLEGEAVAKRFWEEVLGLHHTDPAEKICCDSASRPAARGMDWTNMVHNMLVEMDRNQYCLRSH
jgi:hypothetical protein